MIRHLGILCLLLNVSSGAYGKGGPPGGGGGGSSVPNPTNLSASTLSESSIEANWQSGGGTTVGFKIAFSAAAYPVDCSTGQNVASSLSYTLTGLTAGQIYFIRICAYDSNAVNSSGATVSGVTATPPTAANELWSANSSSPSEDSSRWDIAYDSFSGRTYAVGYAGTDWLIEARNSDGSLATGFAGGLLRIDSDQGTSTHWSELKGVAVDSLGNVYACGIGCAGGNCSASSKPRSPNLSNNFNAVITKFNSSGQRLWTTTVGDDGSSVEMCQSVILNTETGTDFLYTASTAGTDIQLRKLDTNGNIVWSQSINDGGNETLGTAARSLAATATQVFLSYETDAGVSQPVIKLRRYDVNGVDSGLVATEEFTHFSFASSSIHIGQWNGETHLWLAPYHSNVIVRFDLNLNRASTVNQGEGCHELNLGVFGHHVLPYEMATVNEGGIEYLYLAGRLHVEGGTNLYDAVVMRFQMTATECISENESGELFDAVTHRYSYVAGQRAAFLGMAIDDNKDVITTGYYVNSSSIRQHTTVKFSGR